MKHGLIRVYKEVWVASPTWYKVFAKTVLTINVAYTFYVIFF